MGEKTIATSDAHVGPGGPGSHVKRNDNMLLLRYVLLGAMVIASGGCGDAVLRKSVHEWAPAHLRADDAQFGACGDRCTPDMRINDYKSIASLVCTTDIAEKKADTTACKCEKAASDDASKEACTAFAHELGGGS
jgi:hypothetical protein